MPVDLKRPERIKPVAPTMSRVEIEPADNGGFTVMAYPKEPEREGKQNEAPMTPKPKRLVFSDRAAMLQHVESLFGEE